MRFEQTCITAVTIINELMDFKTHHYKRLAEKAEVSERTIARYVKALRLMGYPIRRIFYGEIRGICIDKTCVHQGKVEILCYEYMEQYEK